jgi:hypothetical protein
MVERDGKRREEIEVEEFVRRSKQNGSLVFDGRAIRGEETKDRKAVVWRRGSLEFVGAKVGESEKRMYQRNKGTGKKGRRFGGIEP